QYASRRSTMHRLCVRLDALTIPYGSRVRNTAESLRIWHRSHSGPFLHMFAFYSLVKTPKGAQNRGGGVIGCNFAPAATVKEPTTVACIGASISAQEDVRHGSGREHTTSRTP